MGSLSGNSTIANSSSITYNPQAGATYTIQAGDSNKVVQLTRAAGCAVSLPDTVVIGAGFHCWIQVLNTGTNTLAAFGAQKIFPQGGTTAGQATLALNPLQAQTVDNWASNVHIGCDGSQWNVLEGNPLVAALIQSQVSTRQVLLTGTGATYTRPANCRQIKITAKGGGAGALGSSSDGTGTNGGAGGTTTFNSITAAGGNSGTLANGGVSSPGGYTGASSVTTTRFPGASGYPRMTDFTNATMAAIMGGGGGGAGGGTPHNVNIFGNGTGGDGVANSGGGGAAGSSANLVWASIAAFTNNTGFGGGEGETINYVINSPAATYLYTVGAGGTAGAAGTAGFAGGAGGSGFIIVDEFY